MVDKCLSTAVFCLCGAVLAVLLRQHCREQSLLLAVAVCVGVMVGAAAFIVPMAAEIRDIFTEAGISESYLTLIFKAAAICYVTQITCELCIDSGESAIASAAELWGRAAVTFISLPLIRAVIGQIVGMMP